MKDALAILGSDGRAASEFDQGSKGAWPVGLAIAFIVSVCAALWAGVIAAVLVLV